VVVKMEKNWMMLDGIWEIKMKGYGVGLHICGRGEREVSLKLLRFWLV